MGYGDLKGEDKENYHLGNVKMPLAMSKLKRLLESISGHHRISPCAASYMMEYKFAHL